MKRIIIFLILMVSCVSATEINIYYPNNNTTTDIYYANATGYNHVINNTINDDISVVILKDQAITDDIISHPEKIANTKYISLFIMIILFGLIIIGLIKAFRWGL